MPTPEEETIQEENLETQEEETQTQQTQEPLPVAEGEFDSIKQRFLDAGMPEAEAAERALDTVRERPRADKDIIVERNGERRIIKKSEINTAEEAGFTLVSDAFSDEEVQGIERGIPEGQQVGTGETQTETQEPLSGVAKTIADRFKSGAGSADIYSGLAPSQTPSASQQSQINSIIAANRNSMGFDAAVDKAITDVLGGVGPAGLQGSQPGATMDATGAEPTEQQDQVSAAAQVINETNAAIDQNMQAIDDKFETFKERGEERTNAMIENIKKRYAARVKEMKAKNKARMGNMFTAGIRSGRARFATEHQESILSAEESAGLQRITQLNNERDLLILDAELALEKQEFENFFNKMEMLNNLNQQKVNNLVKLSQLQAQEESLQAKRAERALSSLDVISSIGADLSEEAKQDFDSQLGLGSGFTDQYLETKKQIAEAQSIESQVESLTNIFSLLEKVPTGQSLTIGGTTYTGMRDADPNTRIFKEVDNMGNVSFITVDEETGDVINVSSGGALGKRKTSSGGGPGADSVKVINAVGSETMNELLNSRGDDGFLDTIKYTKAYEKALLHGAETAEAFLERVPPSQNLNPRGDGTGRFLRTTSQTGGLTIEGGDGGRVTIEGFGNGLSEEQLSGVEAIIGPAKQEEEDEGFFERFF